LSWVYDHGTSLAISNSSISRYIAKNHSYFYTLKSLYSKNKVDIVPPSFNMEDALKDCYVPFKGHKKLITSSASARSYKFETQYTHQYCKIIAQILKVTNGRHYHYGPISSEYRGKINSELLKLGVKIERFVNIEWEKEFSKSLLDNKVDVFLSSFPISSARIAIEVNSLGIPIVGHESLNRLFSISHFISPDNFYWEDGDDLFSIFNKIDKNILLQKSKAIKEYVRKNNSMDYVGNMLVNGGSVKFLKENMSHKSFVNIDIGGFVDLGSFLKHFAELQAVLKDKKGSGECNEKHLEKFNNKFRLKMLLKRFYYRLFIYSYTFIPFSKKFLSYGKHEKFSKKIR
jgi:hypothetical protein